MGLVRASQLVTCHYRQQSVLTATTPETRWHSCSSGARGVGERPCLSRVLRTARAWICGCLGGVEVGPPTPSWCTWDGGVPVEKGPPWPAVLMHTRAPASSRTELRGRMTMGVPITFGDELSAPQRLNVRAYSMELSAHLLTSV